MSKCSISYEYCNQSEYVNDLLLKGGRNYEYDLAGMKQTIFWAWDIGSAEIMAIRLVTYKIADAKRQKQVTQIVKEYP